MSHQLKTAVHVQGLMCSDSKLIVFAAKKLLACMLQISYNIFILKKSCETTAECILVQAQWNIVTTGVPFVQKV